MAQDSNPQTPSLERPGRALFLAVTLHVLLVVALFAGMLWQPREAQPLQAEMWAALPEPRPLDDANAPPDPPPVPPPEPEPPTPTPTAPPPEPEPVPEIAEAIKADIALE
ncbi:MAG: hypothetical protein AB7E55_27025, partial [Pigmentiphaga sp.]